MDSSLGRLRLTITTTLTAALVAAGAATATSAAAAIPPGTPYGIDAPINYPTGSNPTNIATGDLNRDGHTDVVTIGGNQGGGINVDVLLGKHAGGYQPATEYDFDNASGFGRIAIADVTGDGNADVVFAGSNSGSSVVEVMAGDGTGALAAPTEHWLLASASGYGIAVGDLNGDHHPDIAVTDDPPSGPGYVSVLLSDGAGSFADPVAYQVGPNPKDIAIADMNHDGVQDLVVANYGSGTVSVLEGDGTGGFAGAASYSGGTDPHSFGLAVDDLNGDGYPDVVVTKYDYDEISVLLNNGSGGLDVATDYPTGGNAYSSAVAIADVNGDHALDVVAIDNQPRVFYGNGDGTLGAAHGTGSWNDSGLAVDDLNGDGRPDLLTGVQEQSGSVAVFLQVPVPTLRKVPAVTTRPTVGSVAFAGTGNWNGSPTTFDYAWQDCNTDGCTDIGAPDSPAYQVQDSDVGYALRVVVTASNAAGASAPAVSKQSAVVPAPPAATTEPTIGFANDNTVLIADHGTWSGQPTSFGYYWFLCDSAGENCDTYLHAGPRLATTQAMVGHVVELDVTGQGRTGYGEATVYSDPIAGVAPANQSAPSITGNAVVGATLTAAKGTWWGTPPRQYQYEWQRCDNEGTCTKIEYPNRVRYVLTSADVSYTIVVVVTASNDYGSGTASSAPTDTVQVSA